MWPFSETARKSSPIEAPNVDRQSDLLAELGVIDAQLNILNHEALEFRRKHEIITDRFNQIVRMASPSMNGRASVEREWRGLLRQADKLLARRNEVLAEWSGLKTRWVA